MCRAHTHRHTNDSPAHTYTDTQTHFATHVSGDLDVQLQALVAFHFPTVSKQHGISTSTNTLASLICDPINSCQIMRSVRVWPNSLTQICSLKLKKSTSSALQVRSQQREHGAFTHPQLQAHSCTSVIFQDTHTYTPFNMQYFRAGTILKHAVRIS